MKYSNLIYDFDGTISDTYPCFTEAFLKTLDYYGISDTYESVYAKLKISVGAARDAYKFPEDPKTVINRFQQYHEQIALVKQKPFAEAEEVLRYAIAKGGKNYLYTHSGKIVESLLERWGMLDCFTYIIDSSQGFRRKPAPDALLYLCEKQGLDIGSCLMIGDRDIDVQSGRNAGMAGCLFDNEHYYDQADCDYRIMNLIELKRIICID